MSLVNMYLHKFSNPKINEYDTLSSEDRWNEYYDIILAIHHFSPKEELLSTTDLELDQQGDFIY